MKNYYMCKVTWYIVDTRRKNNVSKGSLNQHVISVLIKITQDKLMESYGVHIPGVVGSSPTPAISRIVNQKGSELTC